MTIVILLLILMILSLYLFINMVIDMPTYPKNSEVGGILVMSTILSITVGIFIVSLSSTNISVHQLNRITRISGEKEIIQDIYFIIDEEAYSLKDYKEK